MRSVKCVCVANKMYTMITFFLVIFFSLTMIYYYNISWIERAVAWCAMTDIIELPVLTFDHYAFNLSERRTRNIYVLFLFSRIIYHCFKMHTGVWVRYTTRISRPGSPRGFKIVCFGWKLKKNEKKSLALWYLYRVKSDDPVSIFIWFFFPLNFPGPISRLRFFNDWEY